MAAKPDSIASLCEAAVVLHEASDYLALERIAREILALAEEAGDPSGRGWGYYFAGAASLLRNDGGASERALKTALEIFEGLGDRYAAARVMLSLGVLALDVHADPQEARYIYDRAIPIVRESGDRHRLAIALGNLGEICRIEGHYLEAIRNAEEALQIFRDLHMHADIGWQLTNLGHYYAQRRDYVTAVACMREAYPELLHDAIPRWLAYYFEIWFIIAADLERWEEAASLLGFIGHYRDANSAPRMQGLLPWLSLPIERLGTRTRADDHLHDLTVRAEELDVAGAYAVTEGIAPSR